MRVFQATRLIFMVTVLAVLLRALVPAGFMPDLANAKPFHLVLCSLDGQMAKQVDDTYNPFAPAQKMHKVAQFCDFSLSKTFALNNTASMQLLTLIAFSFVAFVVMRTQLRRRVFDYAPGLPRAPPFAI